MPTVLLAHAQVVRRWCSICGALEGCFRSLDINHSTAFIMGASGHAFRINVETTHICRTGPTVIDFAHDHLPLYNNLGLRFELRRHWTDEPTYRAKQRVVWASVLDSLDAHRPAIVWDADIPEFGLIIGHEPRSGRYTFSTMPQPEPWEASMHEVPRNVGVLQLFLPLEKKSCDQKKAARDSIGFAIRQCDAKSSYENYALGFAGYEAWIAALRDRRIQRDPYSHAYNAAVIHEARHYAAEYLREIRPMFDGAEASSVGFAADAFDQVAASLLTVHQSFPVPKDNEPPRKSAFSAGIVALEKAYAAERTAIEHLKSGFPELAEKRYLQYL
jgi:hypothetical protein